MRAEGGPTGTTFSITAVTCQALNLHPWNLLLNPLHSVTVSLSLLLDVVFLDLAVALVLLAVRT